MNATSSPQLGVQISSECDQFRHNGTGRQKFSDIGAAHYKYISIFSTIMRLRNLAIWLGEIAQNRCAHIHNDELQGGSIAERKTRNPYGDEKQIKAGEVTAQINLLALPQTCKRIYLEAVPIVYRRNSFEFWKIESFIKSFLFRQPPAYRLCNRSRSPGVKRHVDV
ncbi:hypothetical protein M434DRAFT_28271 [Hypoxylon sp. CO27-5]|nr:hypothetical protein M434DRAFT_28271 [Hypoxylon sp. CO27-5]